MDVVAALKSRSNLRINIPRNNGGGLSARAVGCGMWRRMGKQALGGSEHIQGCVSGGNYQTDGRYALSTWDIVELLVVEDMREVLGVDLGRVAVDLDARRGLAGQHPHPERQLLALKG